MKFRAQILFIPLLAAFIVLALLLSGLNNQTARAIENPASVRTPQQPYNPNGTVRVNGLPVPNGTVIKGYCAGLTVTPTTETVLFGDPQEAYYDLEIPVDDPETPGEGCSAGETVYFEINGQLAHQTGTWATGAPDVIDLTLVEPSPGISLEKALEGSSVSPMVYLRAGQLVSWIYTITNPGDVTLTSLTVVDDNGTLAEIEDDIDVCSFSRLVPGDNAQCTAAITVTAGLVKPEATASGLFNGATYDDALITPYFGAIPGIALAKSTNAVDADTAPGPSILAGQPVTWTFVVSNTGNISLTGVIVSDDLIGLICQPGTIEPGDPPVPCTVKSTAIVGQYSNLGTAEGTPLGGFVAITATDPSHYFGLGPSIDLEKATNGHDADSGPGPIIEAGAPVSWTFTVSNTGNLELAGVAVSDDQLGPVCDIGSLAVGAPPMICTVEGTAGTGAHSNTGRVEASYDSTIISDEDASHYFGATIELELRVLVNDIVVTGPPGPIVMAGDDVTQTFTVTNTGNISLTAVTVTGANQGIICESGPLDPGEPYTCQVREPAVPGIFSDEITAEGSVIIINSPVRAEGVSAYFGAAPAISLEKSTNGEDADAPPGPQILIGSKVIWRYVTTNIGNVTLTDVVIRDDNGTAVDISDDTTVCTVPQLLPAGEKSCEVSTHNAELGIYTNLGTVSASYEAVIVGDNDPSHYEGVESIDSYVFLPMLIR